MKRKMTECGAWLIVASSWEEDDQSVPAAVKEEVRKALGLPPGRRYDWPKNVNTRKEIAAFCRKMAAKCGKATKGAT